MKILAIEFSSEQRSVGVVEDGQVLVVNLQSGARSVDAFDKIQRVLRTAKLEREAIDCIAVGLGPGSYAGIRAAIALAQGWQLAREVRVVGVSSAEAMAWRAHRLDVRGKGHVLIDAQRGEFYWSKCDFHPIGLAAEPLQLLGLEKARSLQGSLIVAEAELVKLFPDAICVPPDAAMLGLLASRREDFISADRLEPIYLRVASFVKAPPPRGIPPA